MSTLVSDITGITHVPSWLIAVDGDIKTIEPYLLARCTTGQAQDPAALAMNGAPGTLTTVEDYQAGYDVFLTLNHETVHFWHSISTPFMYYYSLDYLTLCLDVVAFADRTDVFSETIKNRFGKQFQNLAASLTSGAVATLDIVDERLRSAYGQWKRHAAIDQESPLCTKQIIEGCAVLCAYRLCDPFASHENFLHHLADRYNNNFWYTGAYRIATAILGEAAFDLFAPACYLALHNPHNPGQGLYIILQHARQRIVAGAEIHYRPAHIFTRRNRY